MNVTTRTLLVTIVIFLSTTALCVAADESSSGSPFGSGQGYLHPTLNLKTEYSDNYLATPVDEKGDWKTSINPGLWIAFPPTQKSVVSIASTNSAVGGQAVSRFQGEDFKGFQGSLMYDVEFVMSHDYPDDQDLTQHRGQGMLQYAFANRLTLEASDVYIDSAEAFADTIINEQEKFDSNLLNLIAYYQLSPKLKFQVGYSKFDLDYRTGLASNFKDRTDNTISSYIFYRALPKTDLFVQYDYVDQEFDLGFPDDNKQNRYYLGAKFDSKARITGHVKAGYSDIKVDNQKNFGDFIGYASLGYALGSNTQLRLDAQQSVDVSTTPLYQNILHQDIGLTLSKKLSAKVDGNINVFYAEEEFRVNKDLSVREDDKFIVGAGLKYTMNDWLNLGMEYKYTDRSSNIKINEYKENWVIFSASAKF